MENTKKIGWSATAKTLGICITVLFSLFSCKQLNSNPPAEQGGRMSIDIQDIQKQVGYPTASTPMDKRTTAADVFVNEDTDVTDTVASLLIGAVIVTSRSIPYDNDEAVTSSISSFLGRDFSNSMDYLKIVELPIEQDTVTFDAPPPGAKNWQIIVVGLTTQPETIADLGSGEHSNSTIYVGFSERFYKAEDIGDTPVKIKMKRACLTGSIPKGCATYGAALNASPVVTKSVEIVGIKVNEHDYLSSTVDFPIFVRTDSDETSAVEKLTTVRREIEEHYSSVSSLSVLTSHTENPYEDEACQALSDAVNENEYTNVRLKTNCDIEEYRVVF
ncbi:MAG: hypothetical protein GY866_31225 [Proteobacteria bacterium]|nr:hypothetical protein [Pseudomonadota bacterium]